MTGGEAGELRELEIYLHKHIPISAAMGVRVAAASESAVRLWAPLDLNINHRSTVFGGSAAAVAILAGWALLHVRLGHGGTVSRIIIQRTAVEYQHPIDSDFEAIASAPPPSKWNRFAHTLERRGRGRIEVGIELRCGGLIRGACSGTYVVLPLPSAAEDR